MSACEVKACGMTACRVIASRIIVGWASRVHTKGMATAMVYGAFTQCVGAVCTSFPTIVACRMPLFSVIGMSNGKFDN